MARPIVITIDNLRLQAELNESPTAQALVDILPTEIALSRWGDEYYGGCGVDIGEADDARELMEVGELAYWPPGQAFCIFFGPTPASSDDRPRAASAVNPVGKILGDSSSLRNLGSSVRGLIESG